MFVRLKLRFKKIRRQLTLTEAPVLFILLRPVHFSFFLRSKINLAK